MNILALDPGTQCGFAHSCGISGAWDLSVRRDESSGMRLIRFRGKLNEIRTSCGVDLVVFEANRNLKHGAAIRVAGAIQGVLELWCTEHEIDYKGYSATAIKKHATGKGNSGKDLMRVAANSRWPGQEMTEDEVDARWLLELAKQDLGLLDSPLNLVRLAGA